MTIYDWPRAVLGERAINFSPRGMTVAGPMTLTGQNQVASLDAGYWVATYELATIGTPDQIRMFRALRAQLEGGAHQVRVPVCDEDQAPWASAIATDPLTATYDDNVGHDDDTPFAQPNIAVTGAAAAARATQLTVTLLAGAALAAGEYFSLGDRLYVIREVLAVSGAIYTLAIWPPLREPLAVGGELNFDAPVCRMRLATEAEMDLALGRLWLASPSANFVEVF